MSAQGEVPVGEALAGIEDFLDRVESDRAGADNWERLAWIR